MSVLLNKARTVSVIWYNQAAVVYAEILSFIWHRNKTYTWDTWDNATWENQE